MLDHHVEYDPLAQTSAVTTLDEVTQARDLIRHVQATPELRAYIVSLLDATRNDPAIALGSSPRAGVQLLRTAKVLAVLGGRGYVTPDDVQSLAVDVLSHRIVPREGDDPQLAASIVGDILRRVPVR